MVETIGKDRFDLYQMKPLHSEVFQSLRNVWRTLLCPARFAQRHPKTLFLEFLLGPPCICFPCTCQMYFPPPKGRCQKPIFGICCCKSILLTIDYYKMESEIWTIKILYLTTTLYRVATKLEEPRQGRYWIKHRKNCETALFDIKDTCSTADIIDCLQMILLIGTFQILLRIFWLNHSWGNSLVKLIIAEVSQCLPYNIQQFPDVLQRYFLKAKFLMLQLWICSHNT